MDEPSESVKVPEVKGWVKAGGGRYLKGMEPRLEEWRLDQAREALRCFRKGIEGWEIRSGGRGREG
jgi:hypothetical protein